MRQLTSLDAQFLAVESARTYGHVGGLAVYDPSTAPGGELDARGLVPARRRAPAPAAAVPLAARAGAVRARPPVLDRGPRLRPRLPHPRVRRAAARRRPAAGRDGGADLRAPARPRPPAVGALRDPRPGRGPRRAADQDPPRGRRRRVGRRDPERAARPAARRAARSRPAAAERRGERVAGRARDARPRRCSALAGSRCARCAVAARRAPAPDRRCPASTALPGAPTLAAAVGHVRRMLGVGATRGVLERDDGRAPRDAVQRPRSPRTAASPSARCRSTRVKAIKNALGVTVNDVVVALCAGAVREWLHERDELPDEPLVAMVPVSVRTKEQRGDVRQPRLDDDRADPDRRGRPAPAPAAHARAAARAPRSATGAARGPADGRHHVHPARGRRARRADDDGGPRPHPARR